MNFYFKKMNRKDKMVKVISKDGHIFDLDPKHNLTLSKLPSFEEDDLVQIRTKGCILRAISRFDSRFSNYSLFDESSIDTEWLRSLVKDQFQSFFETELLDEKMTRKVLETSDFLENTLLLHSLAMHVAIKFEHDLSYDPAYK